MVDVLRAEAGDEVVEAGGLGLDEVPVEGGAGLRVLDGEHLLHDALEESDVAVDADLEINVGELLPAAD